MKLKELERHLRAHGCALGREGGRHTILGESSQTQNHERASSPRNQGEYRPRHL